MFGDIGKTMFAYRKHVGSKIFSNVVFVGQVDSLPIKSVKLIILSIVKPRGVNQS